MKLSFFSNYFSHHQQPLCDAWYRMYGDDFAFVSTEPVPEERIRMGWRTYEGVPFEIHCPGGDNAPPFDIEACDSVILGNAPMSLVRSRLEKGKTVFKYSERVFKDGYNYLKWLPRLFTYRKKYGRYKSLYLLAASAFACADFNMHGVFIGKSYKWGYFPETKHYDIGQLLSGKAEHTLLWCGRLIDWKHPELAVEVARRLKAENYSFHLEMIGTGALKEQVLTGIAESGLEDCVSLIDSLTPDGVRTHMEKAQIFIATSDFHEGWGAVLNESMNSGCAVVASHAIGSVPFLIRHGENGLVYRNGHADDLYQKVKALLDCSKERERISEAAYRTITDLWNAEVAAERFVLLSEEIEKHGYCDLFEDGPCSRAAFVRNNWFRKSSQPKSRQPKTAPR